MLFFNFKCAVCSARLETLCISVYYVQERMMMMMMVRLLLSQDKNTTSPADEPRQSIHAFSSVTF